jgi:hypothetical protein
VAVVDMRTTNPMNPAMHAGTNHAGPEPAGVNDAFITRREALLRVTSLLGGAGLVGGERLLAAIPDAAQRAAAAQGVGAFTAGDIALLDEVAETILPETGTPGAKAAGTGAFMALMVTDVYTARQQAIVRDGMRQMNDVCRREFGSTFLEASPAQRLELLERLDRERQAGIDARKAALTSRAPAAPPPPDAPVHYFRMMKELALLGYFTSEIGYRQAMRYVETPGRFDPCAPYAPGEKIWAPHA